MPEFENTVVRDLDAYDNYLLMKLNVRTLLLYDLQSGETKIVDTNIVTMFGFHKNKIYYIADWSLYVTDLKLREKTVLLQVTVERDKLKSKNLVSQVMFIGDDIFYCQRAPYGIYQYLDGESKLIYDGLNMNGDMNVFLHAGKLYLMKKPGESDILVQYDPETGNMMETLTLCNYKYVSKTIDGYLYYSDLDGKIQKEKTNLQTE